MQRYKTIQNSEFPNQIILCIFAEYMSMKFTLQHKDPASKARAANWRQTTASSAPRFSCLWVQPPRSKAFSTATCATRPGRRSSWRTPTTSTCAPAWRSSKRRGAYTVSRPGKGQCSPTAAASRSSRSQLAASSRRRDAISDRISTVRNTSSPPKASWTPSARSAPTS